MAAITAAMVAQLRERTGLGMMECKKALTETDGDVEAAVELLRKKGVKDRGEREAKEGVVMAYVSPDERVGALVELNSETDFVARNDDFKALARTLAEKIASYPQGSAPANAEAMLAEPLEGGTVADALKEAQQRIGERIVLSRFTVFYAPEGGHVAAYVHNPGGSGNEGGKIGVLVESDGAAADKLYELGRAIAMHVSFSKPKFLREADVDQDVLAKEREIITEQAKNDPKMAGKPEAAVNSMIEGRVRKYLGEVVLLNQPYVRDDKKTVAQIIKEVPGANIVRYARFEVGETVPKAEA
jgi:elongation factor Ts